MCTCEVWSTFRCPCVYVVDQARSEVITSSIAGQGGMLCNRGRRHVVLTTTNALTRFHSSSSSTTVSLSRRTLGAAPTAAAVFHVNLRSRRTFSSSKKRRQPNSSRSRFEQWSRQHEKRKAASKPKQRSTPSSTSRRTPPRGSGSAVGGSAAADAGAKAAPDASDFSPHGHTQSPTDRAHSRENFGSSAGQENESKSDAKSKQAADEGHEDDDDEDEEKWEGWQPYKHGREGIYFFHDGRRSRTSNWAIGLVLAAFAGVWYAGRGQNLRMASFHARPTVLVVAVTGEQDAVSAHSILTALRQCAMKNVISVGFSKEKKLVAESAYFLTCFFCLADSFPVPDTLCECTFVCLCSN